jgi:hypothetical protein
MRKIRYVLFATVVCLLSVWPCHAHESTRAYAVQVSATVQTAPAQISLSWLPDISNHARNYTVYRKTLDSTSWGDGIQLSGKISRYTDTNVSAGAAYEYQVVECTSGRKSYGYVYAGIESPLIESRGKLVLMVDNSYANELTNELVRLEQDLVGDGWTVLRHDVARNATVPAVKAVIENEYKADPKNLQAVFLFGHVPVPYSGDIVPDGHIPNHQGAWPADVYYGDMHGAWTDTNVDDTRADDARNFNVPGDGKFDQSTIPGKVDLMVGRVDLADMPGKISCNGPATFPSELEMLRNYLNKDHKFRSGQMPMPRRGVVGDYFGIRDGEAFAASGWRNFAPFFGANNVTTLAEEGTWIANLSSNAYLWAYGCGPGSYTSVGGAGNTGMFKDGTTTDFVKSDAQAVFFLMFGSWFGDWDSQDDIMRSVLALPSCGLACGWSGRPHWYCQHMALGLPIGYSARLTQNNQCGSLYRNQENNAANEIHIALMGDPTLRMHPVAPVCGLTSEPDSGNIRLKWTAAADSVVGYHVYRAPNLSGPFTRLTGSPIDATSFVDSTADGNNYLYMVRSVKLETSASGTYFNPSEGVFVMGNSQEIAALPILPNHAPAVATSKSGSTNIVASARLSPTGPVVWVDDSTPTNAQLGAAGGDSWLWVSNNPAPYSGKLAHQSAIASGMHQHYFDWAGNPLYVAPGSRLFTYIYLDPSHLPTEILLEWNDGTWDHRAYWGANSITNGTSGTPSRFYMGPLPTAGRWEPLIVPASSVNLDGSTLRGTTFTLYNGRATWDYTGTAVFATGTTNKVASSGTPPPIVMSNGTALVTLAGIANGSYAVQRSTNLTAWKTVGTNTASASGVINFTDTFSDIGSKAPRAGFYRGVLATNIIGGSTNTNTGPLVTITNISAAGAGAVNWVDDATPTSAQLGADGGDSWQWVSSNPAPYSGQLAHQSAIASGMHQHYFDWAGNQLYVTPGNDIFTYVYLDPTNVPSEVLLEWNDGTWDHRAYWGTNAINSGTNGTPSRYYMGPLPTTGQWQALIVPASLVNLDGSTVRGMTFTLFNGRATFDYTGAAPSSAITTTTSLGGTNSGTGGNGGTNSGTGGNGDTNSGTGGNGGTNTVTYTNVSAPSVSTVDDLTLQIPQPGANCLHIISPNTLELVHINTKQPDPAQVSDWNFVDGNGNFISPSPSQISVTVNGKAMAVQSIGFKRRMLYANELQYDFRIENSLYLQLAGTITNDQNVVVQDPDGSLWPSSAQFTNTANPLRFSPVIHVNQEGYVPSLPKQAMIGYYLGSLGEMSIPASTGFQLVDASSGATVYQGSLTLRPDTGWNFSPLTYQKVLMADFSGFSNAGEYELVVPGYGASLPFFINDGIAMDFTRACALGMYSQRCGTNNVMPYTRFTRDVCHHAPANVPLPESNYAFTWKTIASYNTGASANPSQTAPTVTSQATSLYPFINTGAIDVSGGHHDAGDYSKYTINVASLIHFLMFAVDSLPGVASLDNLGVPESGDGISDIMQEAKWEADYLCKIQDADGGFYFLVYPENREYESNVTPDHGDPQVVWPKNTAVTAASVAALAQCASSPLFKKQYPAAAALYMQKANLGWQFLTNAINKYGLLGSYQKITFYGDDFMHYDELAWAACQMFLATGDQTYQQTLMSWFNPSDPSTWRWGWWHCAECYGNAIRSYAFAVQSGRLQASQLNSTFLAACQAEVTAAANDAMTWSQQSSYGTSFPEATKAVDAAGWYFGGNYAFDLAVGYQLNQNTNYLTALVANMNYEGGCNPVNVSYVSGLGWKREQVLVSQMAANDGLALPPTGILVGNVQQYNPPLGWPNYGNELEEVEFPTDNGTTAPYPFYDRWGDAWNVTTEMITLDLARDLVSHAWLATLTPTKSQSYTAQPGTIVLPSQIASGSPVTATFQPPSGMDLTGARVVWETAGQSPAYGASFTFTPTNSAAFWVQAEAQWPDGRRSFAVYNNMATVTVAGAGVVSRASQNNGTWTFTRTGNTSGALTVNLQFTGTAAQWSDYRTIQGSMPSFVTFPAGSATTTMTIYAVPGTTFIGTEAAIVNITAGSGYNIGLPAAATLTLD